MFSHVHVGSNDPARSKRFYDAVMAVLGGGEGVKDPERDRYFYNHDGAMLIVGSGLYIAWREHVRARRPMVSPAVPPRG